MEENIYNKNNELVSIFRCSKTFRYAKHYIFVILTAKNFLEAKKKFILKCLSEYENIVNNIDFDFELFYDKNEDYGNPCKFDKKLDFENWLKINVEDEDIELLGNCEFEIIDRYD
uniref:Uncharacterized protein n=1 Tax=viral metagenome TaxID=1070528 RepID=A0A6C0AEY3_9ZZZZ